MKKNVLLLFLLGIVFQSYGQETTVEPSQQAKSYLDSKNMSVDYSMGVFYYKVPIHEVRMGDFTLPITLDYAARGVKADDKPGVVGYNWSLNTGGVVTRQLRGGIADELGWGASHHWESLKDYASAFACVNLSGIDGESDIFTAVFNGHSVNFVVRHQDAYPFMVAVPLEPTNVRIKCLFTAPDYIYGWEITDEEGNKYNFEYQERCVTLREGTVETNAIAEEYISSWYLSHILPAGMPLITYEYYRDVRGSTRYRDSVHIQMMPTRTTVKYWYGEPIIEKPYNFRKYKNEFYWEVKVALSCCSLDNYDYFTSIERNGLYSSLNDFYLNATLNEMIPERIMQNLKTMGILYDLLYVNEAYEELIYLLDRMIYECNSQASTYEIQQAIAHLRKAKSIVAECREEVNEVYQKDVYQFGSQDIISPMLKKIKSDNSVIEFKYNRQNTESFLLDKIIVRDVNNDSIRSIRLTRNDPAKTLPNEISFHDKSGEKVSNIKFDYYGFVSDYVNVNIYGYYEYYGGLLDDPMYIDKQRFFFGNDGNTDYNSLKTIHVANDAKIELVYDCNTCDLLMNGNGVVYGELQRYYIGGIRIANIKIEDEISGKVDNIYYYYEGRGTYVLPQLSNKLTIKYPGGFEDRLEFDRLYNPGPDAYVKLGNNGVYYSRVSEIFAGNGCVEYDFVVPDRSCPTYNYWNIGNPLGTCFYDEKGHLRKVIRYEYDEELALGNKKYLAQFKRCEYFVNAEELEYKHRGNEYFENNMRQRLYPDLPADQSYRIAYDYSVFLKRISEFYFEGEVVGGEKLDYLRESTCYTKTEFEYNLSKSTFPVKKTITSSDGSKFIEVVKRALDFDDGTDASIPLLKAENMVGVPLKVQTKAVDHDGNERLLTERVNIYRTVGEGLMARVLLTGTSDYTHDGTSVEQLGDLFGFAKGKYDNMIVGYECEESKWLPVSTEFQGDRTDVEYDFMTCMPILEVPLAAENTVAARDYRRFKDLRRAPGFKLLGAVSTKYRLLVLTNSPTAVKVTLTIKSSGVNSTREFLAGANNPGPQMFDLDLTSMTGLEEITLSGIPGGLLYIALVPSDCEFKATSYNADGTVYCKFDQNGQSERYEYDLAGRVVKTFDRDGKLLRENTYNIVIQN